MRALSRLRLKFRSLFRRRRVDEELNEELQFHVDRLAERYVASGMSSREAYERSLRETGSIGELKEQCRDERGLNLFDNLLRDIQYAARVVSRNRAFSIVVVASLALGIAGTSAVFSVVYSMLVDPFPYRDAAHISILTFFAQGIHGSTLLYPLVDYPHVAAAYAVQESFAYKRTSSVTTRGLPQPVEQVGFSPEAFLFLGVPMMRGRGFGASDILSPDAPPSVVVLSHRFWQRYYAGADVIGKTLELDNQPLTVIGIAPPRFNWAGGDVFVPLRTRAGGGPEVDIAVRPRKGVRLSAVSSEADSLTHRLAGLNPGMYPRGSFRVEAPGMIDQTLGDSRETLIVLSAASAFLLLIACTNVSILLFARASYRQRETAVRISLGAGAGRILQQLLTEAIVLALSGGVAGLLFASSALRLVVFLMPAGAIPGEVAIRINVEVVLITFAVCVLAGILFGLLPALEVSRAAVSLSLQAGGAPIAGRIDGGRSRGLLVAAEMALTVLLMSGTAVTVRSLVALHRARLGYDPSNVIRINLGLPPGEYTTWAARAAAFEKFEGNLRSLHGVRFASATGDAVPPWTGFPAAFEIAGQNERSGKSMQIGLVGGDYFRALAIPVLRGRSLTADEVRLASPVAVINDAMAKRYWPQGREPIGARLHVPALGFTNNVVMTPAGRDQWFEVVGIVDSALNGGLRQPPEPSMYVSYRLGMTTHCDFLLKTEFDPHVLIHTIRERAREVVPDVIIGQPLTLDEQLSDFDRALPRFLAALFTLFGMVALSLAATGLYSVVSYGVARRTRELGIRIALGAQRGSLVVLVMGSTARFAAEGLVAGLTASIAVMWMIGAVLPDWAVRDPLPFAVVTVVLLPVGALAAMIPALKATRVAPVAALRHE